MKNKNIYRLMGIVSLVILHLFVSCAEDTPDNTIKFPTGPGWPEILVPERTDLPNSIVSWVGEYRNPERPTADILALSRRLENGVDTSSVDILIQNFSASLEVVEITGRTVKVRIGRFASGGHLTPGVIYTFCTDWTLTGSGSGAVLEFTGSEMPEIFNVINWTVP